MITTLKKLIKVLIIIPTEIIIIMSCVWDFDIRANSCDDVVPLISESNMNPSNESYVKTKIPKKVRMACWKSRFGSADIGSCSCCGKEITSKSFRSGHIVAERHGGTLVPSNMLPICISCNAKMGTMNLVQFMMKNNMNMSLIDMSASSSQQGTKLSQIDNEIKIMLSRLQHKDDIIGKFSDRRAPPDHVAVYNKLKNVICDIHM